MDAFVDFEEEFMELGLSLGFLAKVSQFYAIYLYVVMLHD